MFVRHRRTTPRRKDTVDTLHNATQEAHSRVTHNTYATRGTLTLIHSLTHARTHAGTRRRAQTHKHSVCCRAAFVYTVLKQKRKTHIQLVSVESTPPPQKRQHVSQTNIHTLMLRLCGVNNKEGNCAESKILSGNQHHLRHTQIHTNTHKSKPAQKKSKGTSASPRFSFFLIFFYLFFFLPGSRW